MTETGDARADKVSMRKQQPSARPGGLFARQPVRTDIPKVPTTRTIEVATGALAVTALGLWLRWVGLLGNDSTLLAWARKLNADAKKPVKNFDAVSYVHSVRSGALVVAVLISVLMAMFAALMRRPRSASASRWGVLIILVLTQIPFLVAPVSGWPTLAKDAAVLAGAASIVAIVSLFLPQSSKYFRACREAITPPELKGQPRPGLGSLFKPRPPAGQGGTAAGAGAGRAGAGRAPARTRPSDAGASRPSTSSSSRAKAKVRSDAEAVAKGAELARSRAKTSKSRPSE